MPKDPRLLNDLVAQMAARSRVGYDQHLPGSLDALFRQVAQEMRLGTAEEVAGMVAAVPDRSGPFVLGFSDRMSTWAIRARDPGLLSCAMMAHVLEDVRTDARENILRLAVVWHAAECLEENPDGIFRNAAALGSARASRTILEFLQRAPEMRSIEAMGIERHDGPEGALFRMVRQGDGAR